MYNLINCLRANLKAETEISIYNLYHSSSVGHTDTDMAQVVGILPRVRQGRHIANNLAADDLVTQGAKASAAMTLA